MTESSALDVKTLGLEDYPSVVTNAEENYYRDRDRLREESPAYRVEKPGQKFYTFMRMDTVKRVLLDTETFSNVKVEGAGGAVEENLLPSSKDPPEHARYRAVIAPFFTPSAVKKIMPDFPIFANKLIDRFVDRGHCEYQHEFSEPYPGYILLKVLGVPEEDLPIMVEAESKLWIPPEEDPDFSRRRAATNQAIQYLEDKIRQCQKNPDDSLFSALLASEVDGRKLTPLEVRQYTLILVMGGLHTTKALLGKTMAHLAQNPDLRRTIIENPAKIPTLIEEMLRVYSMGESFRFATKDVEIDGCPVKKGDMVSVNWTAANRDPRAYDCPASVKLDRGNTLHVGFGFGAHICMGMHLARADMRVALDEWHKRIPHYRIKEGAELKEQIWAGAGIRELPLEWDV